VEREVVEYRTGTYTVSTDRARLDVSLIHDFLANRSYWAQGRPRPTVECTVRNSLCFGVYDRTQQVGFARVMTDYGVLAYLMDVFIVEAHRGRGLGKWLIECIVSHPELQGLRWVLATHDAHGLYARYGFEPLAHPEHYLAATDPRPPQV
jgi:GNAT superfamily N-acetyltransferase